MQVVQAVNGTFHHFDLARELNARGHLKRIYSTFPWARLKREGVARCYVRTFPWVHTPWMLANRYVALPERLSREVSWANARSFDAWVALHLEDCDAFVAISNSGLKAGRVAQARGAKYVCDRGSSHIRFQQQILQEEYARWGLSFAGIDPRVIAREEAEYAQADAITLLSEFSRKTFLEMGVGPRKIHKIPCGVLLERFQKTAEPPSDSLDILFAGGVNLRKGIPYLLDAFAKFKHPSKNLRLIGSVQPELRSLLHRFDMTSVEVLGSMPQPELASWMSRSHVLVLPSVEDGFGMVMAQAMACGCVVIASENTGGPDLFTDGVEGFIVPIRSPKTICDRLTQLADNPDLRHRMSRAAQQRVKVLGGWSDYGAQYTNFLKTLTGR